MTISVVIPCRNEVNAIEKCVVSILSSELDIGNTLNDIFIVDGESDDGTIEKIEKLTQLDPRVKLISNPDRITPIAFNLGIKAATSDFVQIIGARQFISSNYLQECLNCFEQDPKIGCVGGAVENSYTNETSEIIAMAMDSPFGVGGSNFRIKKESCYVDTVGTPMYRRSIFNEIGLFNEVLVRNQDDELNYRVTQAGYKIYFTHKATLQYVVRASYKGLKNQYFQYGYWKVYVNKLVGSVTTVRQLFPSLLILGILGGLLIFWINPIIATVYFLCLFSYIALSFYFAIKKTTDLMKLFKIIGVFYILHFSYGWGYLKGIIDFLFLNKKPSNGSKKLTR
ncbi:MAG: glycosyltransferase family 2 protein [Flavobacteriales bacterium]|nr:glycosyltransferase family 2 protein [Flavobacteriales bacterium]MCB9196235.1 glycosyltransferase family 2 protein [Flavobacteriales bacterium]